MKEEIKKELQKLGSSLDKKITPDRAPLPIDYFAQMQKSVLSEIQAPEETKPVATNTFLHFLQQLFAPRPMIAMAGLAAIIIFVFIIKPNPNNDSLILASLDDASTALYIDNYIEEFDEELLVELFAGEEDLNFEFDAAYEDELLDEALENLDISEIEELL